MHAKNRRQAADYQVEPTACTATDAVSLLKLLKHVAADVGVPLARQMILEKLLSGEIRTYRRWAKGYPLFPTIRWAAKLESAPPSFVAEMEGLGFPDFFECGESGIFIKAENRTVFLYASHADAARFWPRLGVSPSDGPGHRGVQGRKAKIDYEAALIEAARFIHGKKPRTHAKVKEHIAEWLGDKAPADSELTKHIGPLCRALGVGD